MNQFCSTIGLVLSYSIASVVVILAGLMAWKCDKLKKALRAAVDILTTPEGVILRFQKFRDENGVEKMGFLISPEETTAGGTKKIENKSSTINLTMGDVRKLRVYISRGDTMLAMYNCESSETPLITARLTNAQRLALLEQLTRMGP